MVVVDVEPARLPIVTAYVTTRVGVEVYDLLQRHFVHRGQFIMISTKMLIYCEFRAPGGSTNLPGVVLCVVTNRPHGEARRFHPSVAVTQPETLHEPPTVRLTTDSGGTPRSRNRSQFGHVPPSTGVLCVVAVTKTK